jgi:hypothetical protein
MNLDRGRLARIDRQLLAGLGKDETYQLVRVPVTPTTWSTWKRYCETVGTSMGRAIMTLIEAELVSHLGEHNGEATHLALRAEERLAAREVQLEARQREVKAAEERLRRSKEQLRLWQGEVDTRTRQANLASTSDQRSTAANTKVGRNEPCPCGSNTKYKWCHGR